MTIIKELVEREKSRAPEEKKNIRDMFFEYCKSLRSAMLSETCGVSGCPTKGYALKHGRIRCPHHVGTARKAYDFFFRSYFNPLYTKLTGEEGYNPGERRSNNNNNDNSNSQQEGEGEEEGEEDGGENSSVSTSE
jgi:hypothetical protein